MKLKLVVTVAVQEGEGEEEKIPAGQGVGSAAEEVVVAVVVVEPAVGAVEGVAAVAVCSVKKAGEFALGASYEVGVAAVVAAAQTFSV